MRKFFVLPVLMLSLLGLAACDSAPSDTAGTTPPVEEPADTTTGQ